VPRERLLKANLLLPLRHLHLGQRRGWILQNPSFYGWGALQAYLPEKDLAIAASATLEKEAKVGLNGGQMVFEEIAAELAPDYPPRP
jgi:hypothetical protein